MPQSSEPLSRLRRLLADRVLPWVYPWEERLLGLRSLPLGERGERLAAQYLQWLGHVVLDRHVETPQGEIDLLSQDGGMIVFVEVKTRSSVIKGRPDEAVDLNKQRKMTQLALAYLRRRRWLDRPARFDVVAIVWDGLGRPTIVYYRAAFDAVGSDSMFV